MGICADCNLLREVETMDGGRICVCDGGSDEMVQVRAGDEACESFEPLVASCPREGTADGPVGDAVSAPAHYAGADGIECMDAMRSCMGAVSIQLPPIALFWWGCAFKYLWRWPLKNGSQDLEKARRCIGYLLDELGREGLA